ncbi:acetyl-CoA carboxylase family protein [Brevibacterium oceani]|uniref:acetyl-CoA carboxylase family protein n=1 Tax=Brevibacterium oceani TaxID=358099 RepID=UPI001B342CA6|nr:carboxyl transferase domain-containing protein [Brevibacterium oceani]
MSDQSLSEPPAILIANRGEIACRIIRTAKARGLRTIAARSTSEENLCAAAGLHLRLADEVVTLPGAGTSAYLDPDAIVAAAVSLRAAFVHPGYGFLSESPRLARACAEAGLIWIGPDPEALELFGDKRTTRLRADELGIPTPPATELLDLTDEIASAAALQSAQALLKANPAGIAVKALAGGGGRGIRIVTDAAEVAPALRACSAEATAGFGDDRIFAEALVTGARHIEVQIIGTAEGIAVLGDRDCSIQRRRQKLIEIAPAPNLPDEMRARLHADAARLTESVGYSSLATVEFLVGHDDYHLLEVNPRIQVEHTVTEAVTGLDLVAAQLDVATHRVPAGIGTVMPSSTVPSAGTAIELRLSAESILASGDPSPSAGRIDSLTWPTGPGVRIDTWVASGIEVTGTFDPLLGKITLAAPTLEAAVSAASQALAETSVVGVQTNAALLSAIIEILEPGAATTASFDDHAEEITRRAEEILADRVQTDEVVGDQSDPNAHEVSGSRRDLGESTDSDGRAGFDEADLEPGQTLLRATVAGAVVEIGTDPQEYVIIEAMKMHHPVAGPASTGITHLVNRGQQVVAGQPIAVLSGSGDADSHAADSVEAHPGVAEVQSRHAALSDAAREAEVAKIRARGRRTARENITDLVDEGSFVEYGPLAIAAQTRRRSLEDLIAKTSGDGLIGGPARVDGHGVVVISYDYSVLAGTQGTRNHAKTDRLIQLAETKQVPIILFAEGGGGRPGDTDRGPTSGLQVPTFASLARLRGKQPLIAIVSGRSFAGNAALAGVCDVIIATPEANIGMGGPAMIEGGGLGTFRPEEIGPVEVHTANGVIDIAAADEADAVIHAKEMLSILSGTTLTTMSAIPDPTDGGAADDSDYQAERARTIVPANRLRTFAIREVIDAIGDEGSFTEVRERFAPGAVTGFIRVDGVPLAIIANDNHHLGGAIDVDAARSFAQHLRLAEDHRIPVLSLIDTPGFMVGPEAEREPGVRAFGDLFVAGAALRVPVGTVVIRKGYGLGAMAMATGGFDATVFTIAWPSGEIGPMGLEGSVRLGYAKELAAIEDAGERAAREAELIAAEYEQGKAMSAAMIFDIDDVIDPALTRQWVRTLTRH